MVVSIPDLRFKNHGGARLRYDAVVIGGGPAGAAASALLARAGRSVCLLERRHGPHHKVCGEFISWEAAQLLAELGLDLADLGAQPITRASLYSGGEALEVQLPDTAWSLSRLRLDDALLRQASALGAEVRRGFAVRHVTQTDTGWQLGAGRDAAGTTPGNGAGAATVCAPAAFLATGKHEIRSLRRRPAARHDVIGLKMHLRLEPAQQECLRGTVELFLFDGGYAGLEAIEAGNANLCVLLSEEIFRACDHHWPNILQWLCASAPLLDRRLCHAQALWQRPLSVAGVPYGYLHAPSATAAGLYRLGDQTAVIASLAGDGIAIALHSAQLAVANHLAGNGVAEYQRRALREFRGPVGCAQALAAMLAGDRGRRIAFRLARLWPGLAAGAIFQTRTRQGRR